MMFWLTGMIVFGGAAVVYRIADDHGHNGVVWSLVAIVSTSLGTWSGSTLIIESFDAPDSLIVAIAAGLPIAIQAVIGVLAVYVPPVSMLLTESSTCSMQWVDTRDLDDTGCALTIAPAGLAITGAGATVIPYSAIIAVGRDGECLTLRWTDESGAETERLLVPRGLRERRLRIRAVDRLTTTVREVIAAATPASDGGRRGGGVPAARVVNH